MTTYQEERLLILTKTYPVPSASYREISCVAAVNEKGLLRRLYPIPYRLLKGEQQFQRWEWVRAKIDRATSDRRPESYRVDVDSIHRLSKIDTSYNWSERISWITPHIKRSFWELEKQRQETRESLGFIRPENLKLIIQKADEGEWSENKKRSLSPVSMFDTEEVKNRQELKKVPYDFYYQYESNTPTGKQQYKHKITDWEISMLYWNCVNRYGGQWEQYFREKIESEFSEKKELIFMMGTVHRFPDIWLIIGVVYPPKTQARQQQLFLSVPDD